MQCFFLLLNSLITSCCCCAGFLFLYVFITVKIWQVFCQRLRQRDIVLVDKNFIEDDLSAFLPLEGVDLTCVRRLSGMSNIHYSTGGPVHRRLGSRCNLASHVTLYSRPGEVSMNKYPDSHETLLGSSPLLVSTSLHREVNPPALVCRVHIKYRGNNHLKQPITM